MSILENLPQSRVRIILKVPRQKLEPFLEEAFLRIGKQVEIAGFRPGVAPRALILEKVGQNRILSEALDLAIPQFYFEAVKEHKLIPLEQPALAVNKYPSLLVGSDAALEFTAEVDVYPKVEIGDYKKNLKIQNPKSKIEEVKPEEIEKVLEHIRQHEAKFQDVERSAQEKDRVEIEFEGFVNNVRQEKYSSKNFPLLLGSKIMLPGFEEALLGMKKNETREFDANIKEEKVHFKVKMLDVKEVLLPPLDDVLAQKFQAKNVAELKEKIKESVKKDKEARARGEREAEILEKLLPTLKAELPVSLLSREIERMKEELNQQLQAGASGLEQFLEKQGKTKEDLEKEFKPAAEKRVKIGLLLGEVMKQEKIDPKDENAGQKVMEKLVSYAVK
ncbi:trigger factor [Candidatus Berkelbacteria bacterium]|nr:trigger factor [Candidatus Berkelbacteria bacterium]